MNLPTVKESKYAPSIDFSKKGGICMFPWINFNPLRPYCCGADETYNVTEEMILLGEEPGPGFCFCFMVTLFCPFAYMMFVCPRLCEPKKLNWYLGCGICGPINFFGTTILVEDGKVILKFNNKHCCTED